MTLDLRTPAWWTIPGELTKNRRPHLVPLTPDVVIMEAQCPEDQRQPNRRVFAHLCESVNDRGEEAGAALLRVLGFEFRGHDLRQTAAPSWVKLASRPPQLSRAEPCRRRFNCDRVYDRYSYDVEKTRLLETWTDDQSLILAAKPEAGAAVVTDGEAACLTATYGRYLTTSKAVRTVDRLLDR